MTKQKTKKEQIIPRPLSQEIGAQANNSWPGLPDPDNHNCEDFENVGESREEPETLKQIIFCGVCGKTIREVSHE